MYAPPLFHLAPTIQFLIGMLSNCREHWLQADGQESSEDPEEESDQAEFEETDELSATKDIAEGARNLIKSHKRRHIGDERALDLVQMDGIARRKMQRLEPENKPLPPPLRTRQTGKDTLPLYTRLLTIYTRNRI
jgi:hypothetical protein